MIKKLITSIFVLLSAACEDTPNPELLVAPKGLSSVSADDNPIVGDDGPSDPISVRFPDLNSKSPDGVKQLTMEVEYLSKYQNDVEINLLCDGLINKSAKLALGKVNFEKNTFKALTVEASSLPIQTSTGAVSLRVEVLLTRKIADKRFTRRILSPTFYYRHNMDFNKIHVFDENTLIRKYNGVLSGGPERMKQSNGNLGRLKIGDRFTEVNMLSEDHAVRQNGKIIGWEGGTHISIESEKETEGIK